MLKKQITKSAIQTKKLGEKLARKILKIKPSAVPGLRARPQKRAFVIGLEGDLGSGKTTFLQGFAKGLGIKEKILSPTFVIMKKFIITKIKITNQKPKFKNFYHIDCYRIQKPREILDLGFKEIIPDSQNIIAIEWAEKIKKILPGKRMILKFKFVDEKTRKITRALD